MEPDSLALHVMMCLKAEQKNISSALLSPYCSCTGRGRQAIHQQANIVRVTEESTPTAARVPHTSIYLMSACDVWSPWLEIQNLESPPKHNMSFGESFFTLQSFLPLLHAFLIPECCVLWKLNL